MRGQCKREVPVTLRLPSGGIIEGVVDLAFLENDVWAVVDFKTDRELENGLEHYKRQAQLYCAAVAAATGQQSHGILMHV